MARVASWKVGTACGATAARLSSIAFSLLGSRFARCANEQAAKRTRTEINQGTRRICAPAQTKLAVELYRQQLRSRRPFCDLTAAFVTVLGPLTNCIASQYARRSP